MPPRTARALRAAGSLSLNWPVAHGPKPHAVQWRRGIVKQVSPGVHLYFLQHPPCRLCYHGDAYAHTAPATGREMSMPDEPQHIDFYFDVMCPWAYQTSKWIREVRAQNGLDIYWKFFSLEEINRVEGKKHPWERPWSYGWSLLRIGALLRRQSMAALDRFYAVAGQALHEAGEKVHLPDGAKDVVRELGFD